jgi:hypothetical protein
MREGHGRSCLGTSHTTLFVRPQRAHRRGFFDRLFGKRPTISAQPQLGEDDDIQPTSSQPTHGPPELVRTAEMQRAYSGG